MEPELIADYDCETGEEREITVTQKLLERMAEGLTNQQIADRLGLALNTVKVHTRNIHGKLHAHSRTQAVAEAQRLDLLQQT